MIVLLLGFIGLMVFCLIMFHLCSDTKSSQIEPNFENQEQDDSIEASEADGLILFDDPLFPEEFDDE